MPPSTSTPIERAVSPVVGVVLMVAITVVLAATVGAFVMGLAGSTPDPAPSVRIAADYAPSTSGNGDVLTLTVESADNVPTDRLALRSSDIDVIHPSGSPHSDQSIDSGHLRDSSQAGTTLQAGDTVVVDNNAFRNSFDSDEYLDLGDATIRLVWEDGGSSSILYTWEAS